MRRPKPADTGYDSTPLLPKSEAWDWLAVIPSRRCTSPAVTQLDSPISCNRIERCFNRLKQSADSPHAPANDDPLSGVHHPGHTLSIGRYSLAVPANEKWLYHSICISIEEDLVGMRSPLLHKPDLAKDLQHRRYVTGVARQLRGGSQPRLVRCDDDNLYVLKLSNNLQGSNVLANEWIGTALLSALGVNTPTAVQICLTASQIRRLPLLKIEGRIGAISPVPGRHFGSRLVGDVTLLGRATDCAYGAKPSNTTNLRDFALVFLLDAWANATDRREVLFIENGDGTATACFIDHGHLFGGPSWTCGDARGRIYLQHEPFYVASLTRETIDDAISKMGIIIPEVFARTVATLPPSWYRGDIDSLQCFYMRRLHKLKRLMGVPALLHPGWEHLNGAFRFVRL